MTDRKEKSIRVLCYVPVNVKKTVQELRANDPRTSPPSENACFVRMIERGLIDMSEYPRLFSDTMFRIDKNDREYFAPVGIRMPESMHRELKAALKTLPQKTESGHEPVNYRFIDLIRCLLSWAVSGFQIKNI